MKKYLFFLMLMSINVYSEESIVDNKDVQIIEKETTIIINNEISEVLPEVTTVPPLDSPLVKEMNEFKYKILSAVRHDSVLYNIFEKYDFSKIKIEDVIWSNLSLHSKLEIILTYIGLENDIVLKNPNLKKFLFVYFANNEIVNEKPSEIKVFESEYLELNNILDSVIKAINLALEFNVESEVQWIENYSQKNVYKSCMGKKIKSSCIYIMDDYFKSLFQDQSNSLIMQYPTIQKLADNRFFIEHEKVTAIFNALIDDLNKLKVSMKNIIDKRAKNKNDYSIVINEITDLVYVDVAHNLNSLKKLYIKKVEELKN